MTEQHEEHLAEELGEWWTSHKGRLADERIVTEFFAAATSDPPSAFIDFDNMLVYARATVSDSGYVDVEMLNRSDSSQIFFKHHDNVSRSKLHSLLDGLLQDIRGWRRDQSPG